MKFKLIFLMLIAISATSCNSSKKVTNKMSESTLSIRGTSWELVSLNHQKVEALKSGKLIELHLDSKKDVSGFSGCNHFMGSYKLGQNNSIEFSSMASTRMACLDENFNENEFLGIFSEVKFYTVEGDILTLLNKKNKKLATFRKLDNADQITEKHWKLMSVDGKAVKMSEHQSEERYFVLKSKDNQITGFAGCNNFTGVYTLENNNKISFSKMAATLRACPDSEINDTQLFKVFKATEQYTYDNDKLELKDKDGKTLAQFDAVYF